MTYVEDTVFQETSNDTKGGVLKVVDFFYSLGALSS